MKWLDFDGPEVPRNRAGETYPSQYRGEGGRAIVSLDPKEAVSGHSVRFEVTRGTFYAHFNSHNADGTREFLEGRRGAGMSRLFDALQRAFRICGRAPASWRPGAVLLYTDGIPTFGRRSEGPRTTEAFFSAVKEANPAGVRVNAYAVSATSEGRGLLERLCSENEGILFSP